MRKIFRPIAILALAALVTTSCSKESIEEGMQTANTVQYTVSGEEYSIALPNDESWNMFLDRMFALAKEGETVVIWGNSTSAVKYKETVTFTTTSEAEAKSWTTNMLLQGYTVDISYDEGTGVYTCVARR